jgi:glucoamylase
MESPSRRAFLWAVPIAALAVAGGSRTLRSGGEAYLPLFSSTVAIGDHQQRVLVPPDANWTEPGSRVLRTASQRVLLRQQELAWLRLGHSSGNPGEAYFDASQVALLDLRVLTGNSGGPVAGWTPSWRYVWPRDTAFVVAALTATGYSDEARRALAFLQRVQSPDGTFQARYTSQSERPPDLRGVQLDGTGWSLWGLLKWAQSLPAQTRLGQLRQFASLLDRSSAASLRLTRGGTALPPASLDYWEIETSRVTLGNAALFLVGFQAAAKLYAMLGDTTRVATYRGAGERYREVIAKTFSPNGYPRFAEEDSRDAAVAFLLPPFVDDIDSEILDAWVRARKELSRPAGGLAPGAAWVQDGVSWTPETALFAMTAASLGAHEQAKVWLDWLLAHRTQAGSFPEKVISDGSPAFVAPLAWTTAAVILAIETIAAGAAERPPDLS